MNSSTMWVYPVLLIFFDDNFYDRDGFLHETHFPYQSCRLERKLMVQWSLVLYVWETLRLLWMFFLEKHNK